jgi:ABC-2 type transport system permease protein
MKGLPLSGSDSPLQWLMMTALPMGFMNYVPVCHLLGKEPAVVGEWGGALAPLAGPLSVLLAMAYWRVCLRHYQGAGG